VFDGMKRVCLFFLWGVMGGGTANGSAKGREQQNKLSIPIKLNKRESGVNQASR